MDQTDLPHRSVVDVPIDWYQANLFSSGSLPNLSYLTERAVKYDGFKVVVPKANFRLKEARNWLHDQQFKYSLLGRFEITKFAYRTDCSIVAFVFTFANDTEGTVFRLFI